MNANHQEKIDQLRDWWNDRPDACWDPVQGLQSLREEIVSRTGYAPAYVAQQRCVPFWPRIDLFETDSEYLVSAEMPGLSLDDITLSVRTNDLTIRGERRRTTIEGRRVFLEQLDGAFSRTLTLDHEVNGKATKATLSNGILQITLPKKGATANGRSNIKIDVA